MQKNSADILKLQWSFYPKIGEPSTVISAELAIEGIIKKEG
jgi:hypothetical protein